MSLLNMNLTEIKIGEIFTFGKTPKYPKLRTEKGYIDMKDFIKKETKNLPWDLCLISDEEIKQLYNVDDIEKWKQYVIENT